MDANPAAIKRLSGVPWMRRVRDIAGIVMILLGVLTVLALVGVDLGVFVQWAGWLRQTFGMFAIVLALLLVAFGVPLVLNSDFSRSAQYWLRMVQAEGAFLALISFTHAILAATSNLDPAAIARAGRGGGQVGFVLSALVANAIGSYAVAAGIAFALLSLATWFLFRPFMRGVAGLLVGALDRARDSALEARLPALPPNEGERVFQQPSFAPRSTAGAAPDKMREAEVVQPAKKVKPAEKPSKAEAQKTAPTSSNPAAAQKPAKAEPPVLINSNKRRKQQSAIEREATLPPLSLLKYAKNVGGNPQDVNLLARKIEETLQHFGLVGHVREIRQGPAVTQFGVEPGYLERPGLNGEKRQQKIRVGQIAALQNDLALALSAASLRIEAPIPGKQLVGIEVPNNQVGMVDMRTIVESEPFQKLKAPLAVALGKDVSGTDYAADLSRMPHLLIAGTTGSGKSVCVSAICVCLAMNNHPDDLKLVMIDPKRVELSRFAGLPHIIGKPEGDMDRIPAVLRWVVHEMDARYKRFALVGARNLKDYNEGVDRRAESEPDGEASARMPRIVVLIDELADLMMQNPVETEKTLCRLAQMARATGIHLVVATQRPSVDVVTGLIKANFPARISFAVASAMDSRVILDQTGAESLLGKGDMLFLNPEAGSPIRLQGCFVSDKEMDGLIDWWKSNIAQEEDAAEKEALEAGEEYVAMKKPKLETPWDMIVGEIATEKALAGGGGRMGGGAGGGGDDDLINKAMELIRAGGGNVSTSFLQRKLKLGYPRAKALMEELEEMGYVGGASKAAGRGREVMDGEIHVQ